MKVLLIGGSGFIGPPVSRRLVESGHDVTVFHRGQSAAPQGTREIIGDRRWLADQAIVLRTLAPDVVVDLVLSSGRQARDLMNVFEGVASRVVALSSCDVYRACGVFHESEPGPLEPLPLTETSALRTVLQTYPPDRIRMLQQVFAWLDDEYDKIPVEREVLGRAALPGTVLRLPMVYGPGDPLHRLKSILSRMDANPDVLVFEEKYAALRAPRGYVENVADAITLAATDSRAARRIYNVAEPEALSELEWARAIGDVAGWHGRFETQPFDRAPEEARLPGNLDQHWVVDSSRIREELGYRERVPRADAIERTIEWERRSTAHAVGR